MDAASYEDIKLTEKERWNARQLLKRCIINPNQKFSIFCKNSAHASRLFNELVIVLHDHKKKILDTTGLTYSDKEELLFMRLKNRSEIGLKVAYKKD